MYREAILGICTLRPTVAVSSIEPLSTTISSTNQCSGTNTSWSAATVCRSDTARLQVEMIIDMDGADNAKGIQRNTILPQFGCSRSCTCGQRGPPHKPGKQKCR